jgi:hypothetical protein
MNHKLKNAGTMHVGQRFWSMQELLVQVGYTSQREKDMKKMETGFWWKDELWSGAIAAFEAPNCCLSVLPGRMILGLARPGWEGDEGLLQ